MGYKIAVLGATGAVGREMINVLEEYQIPVDELKLLASARSAGQTIPLWKRRKKTVSKAWTSCSVQSRTPWRSDLLRIS